MGRTKKVRSAGRLSVRYGRRIRKMVIEVESVMRQRHRCPNCLKFTVSRKFAGIWECSRCRLKFAGKAYKPY